MVKNSTLFVVIIVIMMLVCSSAFAEQLTPRDFRPANPNRAFRSYMRWADSGYFEHHLFVRRAWDKNYEVRMQFWTRNLVRRLIQYKIDSQNILDPAQIQFWIDSYKDVTPEDHQVIVWAFLKNSDLTNHTPERDRFFREWVENFSTYFNLEYGYNRFQDHSDMLNDKSEHRFRALDTLKFTVYGKPIDPTYPYMRTIHKELLSPPAYMSSTDSYVIKYRFDTRQQIAGDMETPYNTLSDMFDIMQTFGDMQLLAVVSDPFFYASKEIRGYQKALVLYAWHPDLLNSWKHASYYKVTTDDFYSINPFSPEEDRMDDRKDFNPRFRNASNQ